MSTCLESNVRVRLAEYGPMNCRDERIPIFSSKFEKFSSLFRFRVRINSSLSDYFEKHSM